MADGDGAAVDVHVRGVPAHVLVHGAGLRGEGFVGFDEIEIAGFPAGLFQRRLRSRDRARAHDLGSTPACAQDAMRASGFSPRFSASSALISTARPRRH